MRSDGKVPEARTQALRALLRETRDLEVARELLFLEEWEINPSVAPAVAFRASQLRRANPSLAAAIREELARRRP